jgi:hypothetical protein
MNNIYFYAFFAVYVISQCLLSMLYFVDQQQSHGSDAAMLKEVLIINGGRNVISSSIPPSSSDHGQGNAHDLAITRFERQQDLERHQTAKDDVRRTAVVDDAPFASGKPGATLSKAGAPSLNESIPSSGTEVALAANDVDDEANRATDCQDAGTV